ncbi:SCA7, zinc-binding domain-containing protein [Lipomyces kononenkoae]|uniref:SCA7, zinc-binding domain-containing protein n=1 Tax=Lipomyces kononenkoae TaxID=34357 RepID=A0ACC3TAM8_LIPKO
MALVDTVNGGIHRPAMADDELLSKVFGSTGSQSVHLKHQAFSLLSSSVSQSSSQSSSSSASSLSSVADSDPTWVEYAKILEDEDSSSTTLQSTSPERNLDSPSPFLDIKDRQALASSHPLTDRLEYSVCTSCDKPYLRHILASHIRECLERSRNGSQSANGAKKITAAAADSKSRDSIKLSTTGISKDTGGHGGNKGGSSGGSNNAKGGNGGGGGTAGGTGSNGGGGDDGNGNSGSNNGKSDKPTKAKKDKESSKDKEKDTAEKDGKKKTKKRKAETPTEEKKPPKKKKKQPPKAAPKPKGPVDVERQCGVPLPNGGFCARSLTCKSHSMGAKRNVPGRSQPYDVLLAAYQKKNQMKQAALTSSAQLAEDMELANGPVDSDEEVESVMAGVHKSFPVPIEKKVIMPIRIKNQFFRMREMFASAFSRQI